MSLPKKQKAKQKTSQSNVATLVDNIAASDVPEYEKILLQLRVFKEKQMYSIALQLFKKGLNSVQQQIQQQQQQQTNENTNAHLNLVKARYYHQAACVFYELNKYVKAISYSVRALEASKGILDSSAVECMRFKHVLAVSYKAMEQHTEALQYYDTICYALNVHIKSLQHTQIQNGKQQDAKQNDNDDDNNNENENENDREENKTASKTDGRQTNGTNTLKELQMWRGDMLYDMAMIYNSQREFEKASKYAKQCCVIRNLYQPNTSKQILALMLVAVVVSSPQITEYKLALDNLEKAKQIISTHDNQDDMKQYEAQIQKLSMTVLNATVRWSKVTNTDLDSYLKTGQRRKANQSDNNKKK